MGRYWMVTMIVAFIRYVLIELKIIALCTRIIKETVNC